MDNYLGTDVSVFGMRWFKNTPISEIVGNGLRAVPGDVMYTTRVDEWDYASRGG